VSRALKTLGALGLLAMACGPKSDGPATKRDLSQFECNERMISYMVAGGFAAEEAGVTVLCDNENPRLITWRLDDGQRSEKTNPLSGDQFDTLWKNIDSSGWRFVEKDCKNPDAKDGDPSYLIEVGDSALTVTLNCDGTTLPFPYDRIVNELDLRAAGFGDQDAPPN
jgi:hypothetical protein